MQQTAHKVVVIGHRNPDTDSICSAIAYAELKNKTSDLVCEARRAGKMNQETEFVLKKFGVKPPRMCTDVNPKIRDVDYREMPGIPGSTSLRKAWEIMRDQQIDTLSITSADNELEGIITVKDLAKVAELAAWKAEGALSLMVKGDGIQAVYGPKADVLKSDINDIL